MFGVEGIGGEAVEAVVEVFAAVFEALFLLLLPAALLLLFALLTTVAHWEIPLGTSVREWFCFDRNRKVLRSAQDDNIYRGAGTAGPSTSVGMTIFSI